MWPTTRALFSLVGIDPAARCLDLGCGGGDVSIELAGLVPDGSVVGTDLDDIKIELARAEASRASVRNVSFRVEDVTEPCSDGELFDLVYTRFVLTHLPDPSQALLNIYDRLTPGGVLIAEDCDFRGGLCYPDSAAFSRFIELYTKAVQSRGGDPNIGPRLPTLLREAGFNDLSPVNVVYPADLSGEVKLMAPLTLEAMADAVLAANLVDEDELNQIVDELFAFANRDDTVLSPCRIVQVWGRRSHT
jgi:SAM-dependent methyltransferase